MVNRKRRVVSAAFVALLCAGVCGCVPIPHYIIHNEEYYGIVLDGGHVRPGVGVGDSVVSDDSGAFYLKEDGHWQPWTVFLSEPFYHTTVLFRFPETEPMTWQQGRSTMNPPDPRILVCDRWAGTNIDCDEFEIVRHESKYNRFQTGALLWYHARSLLGARQVTEYTRQVADCRFVPPLMGIFRRATDDGKPAFREIAGKMLETMGCEPATEGSCEEYLKTVKCVP